MRVAPQHKWKDAEYKPSFAWAEDDLVQWGSSGIVLGANPYRTAFFEAFPADKDRVGGFIRGEGKTLHDAECAAFAKYQVQSLCTHHWGREGYTNGGQMCRHCRAFRSGILKPVVILGRLRQPVHYYETWIYEIDLEEGVELSGFKRKLWLRSRLFGVTQRPKASPTPEGMNDG